MNKLRLKSFQAIGISVRTSKQNGLAAEDIPTLWQKFTTGNIIKEIPNKASSEIYAIYTNYEGDHNLPYDFILGCKVLSTQEIPSDMVSVSIPSSNYKKVTVQGDLEQG
jgi:predicted transcriptional regulator YdeE